MSLTWETSLVLGFSLKWLHQHYVEDSFEGRRALLLCVAQSRPNGVHFLSLRSRCNNTSGRAFFNPGSVARSYDINSRIVGSGISFRVSNCQFA